MYYFYKKEKKKHNDSMWTWLVILLLQVSVSWHLRSLPSSKPSGECDRWQLFPNKVYSPVISTFTILFITNQKDLRAVSFLSHPLRA